MSPTRIRYPNSDVSIEWDRSSGSTNYENVDEPSPYDDLDYNYKSVWPMYYDKFGFAPFGFGNNTLIVSVKVTVRGKTTSSNFCGYRCDLVVGGTTYSSTIWYDTVFTTRTYTWNINPKTGLSWTVGEINGTSLNKIDSFGYSASCGTPPQTAYVSAVNLTVTYNLISPVPSFRRIG